MPIARNIQLGKSGVTEGFLENLKKHFENTKNIKISVLRSATRDRKEIKEMAEKIVNELGKNYNARVIGFTIAIKKWRKEVR